MDNDKPHKPHKPHCPFCEDTGKKTMLLDGRKIYLKCECQGKDEKPGCAICKDTGWKMVMKDGREVAQRCECQVVDIHIAIGQKANIPPRFLSARLDYYFTNKNESLEEAKKVAEKFIQDYPVVIKGILLQGPVGVGKTKLLCTIGMELIQKNKNLDIYYIDYNELVKEMRFGDHIADRDYTHFNQLIYKLSEVDILILDELGSSTATTWVLDNIYYIINKRYNHEKITLCATNYLDKSTKGHETLMKRIGENMRSRLYEMTSIVKIIGEDLRAHDKSDKITSS